MNVAEIKLWGKRIGVVSLDDNSPYVYFKYDDDFIKSGIQLSPIMMPLSDEIYQFKNLPLTTFKGLPGLLSDSLPDRYGDILIDAWLGSQGRQSSSMNIMERLCYIGTRGMGALEYHPIIHDQKNMSEHVYLNQLVELSNTILKERKENVVHKINGIEDIIKVGTSAGGARAKAIVAFNEKTGAIKSGQVNAGEGYSYWIIKLDGINHLEASSYTKIEFAYYLMAQSANIIMQPSKLLKTDNLTHFMTKRFDRIEQTNGHIEKRHMQTLGALLHIDYNEAGVMSYEETAKMMYQLNMKPCEISELFRRMIFNVMARNQDDHVKNISFLMDKSGVWSLSPAYDMTYSYNPNGMWTSKHQMTINGKVRDFLYEDIMHAAEKMFIKPKIANKIISEVKNAIMQWPTFAMMAELDEKETQYIQNQMILINPM